MQLPDMTSSATLRARAATRRSLHRPGKRLFIGGESSLRRMLIARAVAVVLLYLTVVLIFWVDRDGLVDHHDGRITFTDIVYFSVVTVTTVGYGDIVPVTTTARTMDALLVTPIRLFIWLIFLGTAYQLVLQQLIEDLRMRILQAKLRDHVIICGFGHAGRCAAAELVARGMDEKQVIVIDSNQTRIEEAAEQGYIGLLGNAAREEFLREAKLETARAIFVCTDRDDTNVLIVLTARHLSAGVRIVARVEESENEKLLKQSGANATVLPSRVGGVLMAGSLDSSALLGYVMDLVSVGGRLTLFEREARPEEIGKLPTEIEHALIVRIARGDHEVPLTEPGTRIAAGDTLVLIVPEKASAGRHTRV
jgi:voltage-gated potassium channel